MSWSRIYNVKRKDGSIQSARATRLERSCVEAWLGKDEPGTVYRVEVPDGAWTPSTGGRRGWVVVGYIRSHFGPSRTDRGSTRWFTWYKSMSDVSYGQAVNWSESLGDTIWENVR